MSLVCESPVQQARPAPELRQCCGAWQLTPARPSAGRRHCQFMGAICSERICLTRCIVINSTPSLCAGSHKQDTLSGRARQASQVQQYWTLSSHLLQTA